MITKLVFGCVMLSMTLSSAVAGEGKQGRYVLVPIKDGEVLVLLDTVTGQNWSAKPIEEWKAWPSKEERERLNKHKMGSMPRTPIQWYPNFYVRREYAREITSGDQTVLVPFWEGEYLPPAASDLGEPRSPSEPGVSQ